MTQILPRRRQGSQPFGALDAATALSYGWDVADRDRSWQHPWLRISLLLRSILGTPWDAETWEQIRLEIPKALAKKASIQRAGWFN